MEQAMFDWLTTLFGDVAFMPHGHCYLWTPELLWLMVGSDVLIAASYFAIPALLVYFLRRRPDVPFRQVFWLFGAFIVLCGLTHVVAVFTTWQPAYWLEGIVKLATAVVSLTTAVALVPILPQALSLRSAAELNAINEELTASNRRLAAANAELEGLYQELMTAQEGLVEAKALRELNDDLQILTAAMSHDLRAPLLGIKRAAHFLRETDPPPDPEEAREVLDLLYRRTDRLDNMIRGLLTYYRAGQESETGIVADVQDMLEHVRELVGAPEGFQIDISSSIQRARIAEMPLVQILVNLLSNAIRHHDRPDGRVSMVARREGDVVFDVIDDGPGIPEEFHDRIFVALSTLSPRDDVESNGLGLALVKRIAERLGGGVTVRSAPGEGATFTVRLPESA
jgi:signal transduction histidine kinase